MRRKFTLLVLLILVLLSLVTATSRPFGQTPRPAGTGERPAFQRAELSHGQKYVPDEVLVRFKAGTSPRAMLSAHARMSAEVRRSFTSVRGLQLVKVPAGTSVKNALHSYLKDPNVLYAEPNYIVHALTLPNDPLFPQQWGLNNTGQDGGAAGADIHAPQAWALSTGSASVVVATLDTGIDYTHPDLAANVWAAPTGFTFSAESIAVSCPSGSHGINLVPYPATCDPMDDNSHGTHVSGIIGASGNNGVGVAGVNWNVSLMACKFLDIYGAGDESGVITCLDFVKAMKDSGVNIVATNNSWGGFYDSQVIQDAITAQEQDGILFVAAAGNEFVDNDLVPTFPANYFLPNLLSVAATTRTDDTPTFSNLGRHTVHLGAPGRDILSTTPNNTYSTFSGTSMAAPFVTGVVALLKAQNPSLDWRAIKNLILAGGDTIPSLGQTVTGKRLNAYGSMTCSGSTVGSRLQPSVLNTSGAVGSPVALAYLNINCGQPNGSATVQSSNGDTILLQDDGTGVDQEAGDGIYSGQWTPPTTGSYTLTFPNGDNANVDVLTGYYPWPVAPSDYSYRTISGVNLDLGDDSVAAITSPFPVQFGGGSFSNLYVSSNGTISFTDVFGGFVDTNLPPPSSNYLAYSSLTTLVAPFWEDLYAVPGSNNNVFWDVVGTAPNRELVVEWRNVESFFCHGDASATVTFQVVFQEGSSDVLFNYANATFGGNCSDEDNGARAEVGIQVAQTQATSWSFSEPQVGNGTGILWKLTTGTPVPNPVPAITSISPATAQAGGPDFVLTVTGSNFVPQSTVESYGHHRPTTFVSSTELQALIPARDIQYNVLNGIDVYNPVPGGGRSNVLILTVTGQSAPVITALNPPGAVAGGFGFALEVDGTGFLIGSTVQWNGVSLPTVESYPKRLVAQATGDLIANAGTVQITVNNFATGGLSNAVPFTIATATTPSPAYTGPTGVLRGPAADPRLHDIPGTIKSAKFLPRFLGWNLARKEGPEYVQHFSRPHAGTAPPIANSKWGNPPAGLRQNPRAQALGPAALPGFQFRPSIPSDYLPTSVVAGDFNHDGHMDWVVANGGANTLWIYFGKGDGTAQLPVIIPLTGQAPVYVAAADLRGSGNLDLIVAEADSGQVGVLLGNGDGTFGVEQPYYVPGAPIWLLIDDFHGDGRKDILVGMAGNVNVGELTLLPGDGTGHFGSPIYRPYENPLVASDDVLFANNIAEADLNGDGYPDLVVNDINPVSPGVYAYLNQKDGTFKIIQGVDFPFPNPLPRIITDVALGDVNGDGCADLIDTDDYGTATLFPGNCDGTFQNQGGNQTFGVGDVVGGLALADVNGDGKLDIVSSCVVFLGSSGYGGQPGNVVSVLLGDGHGNFSNARVFRGQPSMYSFAFADLNGDGKLDMVTANQDADSVSVFLNDGTGGFGQPVGDYIGYLGFGNNDPLTMTNAPDSGFKVADVNGDGKPDLVLLELGRLYPEPINLTVLLNKGSGQFSAPIRSAVIDETYKTNGYVGDFALGDFRNTGRPDFVAVGSPWSMGTSYIAFARNNGDGTFTSLPLAQPPGAQGFLGTGDFNGDGKLDVVVAGTSSPGSYPNSEKSTLNVFLGNGDGTFTPGFSTTFADVPGAFYPVGLWAGDFNGDGKPDVLVQVISSLEGTQGHDVYEFLGKGDGTFSAGKVVLPNFGGMNVADLNHDGIDDVVEVVESLTTPAYNIPLQYAVYLGQSDGSFVLNNTYQLSAGAANLSDPYDYGIMLADFNGDGNIDIGAFQFVPAVNPGVGGPHTLLQVLAGNGDGTFTPTSTTFDFNEFLAPQFAADLNGDGKADLLQLAGFSSSYNIVMADTGPALQLNLLSLPVVGATGSARVTLAIPPTTDTTVQLASSDPAISLPASITVPANTASQDFQFQIGSGLNPNHVLSLQATVNTQTATAYAWKASGPAVGFRLSPINTPQTILPGQTSPYSVLVSSIGGYSTNLQLSCTGLPSWATCVFAAPRIQLPPGESVGSSFVVNVTSAGVVGTYPFVVVATDGSLSEQLNATLSVGDFGVNITPSTATVPSIGMANYNVSVPSVNGYGGVVWITVSGLPAGATASIAGFTDAGEYYPLSLGIQTTNVPQGNYTFTVTGTSDPVAHSAQATLQVQGQGPDFTIGLSPASLATTPTNSASYTLTIGTLNGFTGSVGLSASGLPSGATITNLPAFAGPGTYGLTVRTQGVAEGSYLFTVTGTSGSLTHSASATLQVQAALPDFSGSVSPTSATLSVGQSASFTVTVNSQNSATGAVTLQCQNVPSGSTCSFNPTAPTLPANGSASDTLTVQVNTRPAAAPPGFPAPRIGPDGQPRRLLPLAIVLTAALLLGMVIRRRQLRLAASLLCLIGLASFFVVTASCGGGGGSGPPPPPQPVTFTINVQAGVAGISTTKTLGTLTITVN